MGSAMSKALCVVMLSTADWDAELWTNKQHTARSLRDHGARVLYVESMGLRRPSLRREHGRRIVRRLQRLARGPVEVEPNIWRLSPPSIPLQGSGLIRTINKLAISGLLRLWCRRLLKETPCVWTYNPMTTALFHLPKGSKLVYHCVDDIAAQPAMPVKEICRFETELVRRADHVFVTSRSLEARWSPVGRVTYLPNCVDVAHFQNPDGGVSSLLDRVPQPRLGFVGAITEYKVDVELLCEVAQSRQDWSVVLVGPIIDSTRTLSKLLALSNVHHLGVAKYKDLPAIMRALDVGLIPALANTYTASMFPMKFLEYLAAGLSVVATDLPALSEYKDVAAIVGRDQFVQALENVVSGTRPSADRVQRTIAVNSYSERTSRMLAVIDA